MKASKQEEILREIQSVSTTRSGLKQSLERYFPEIEITSAFEQASRMIFTQLLEDLIPTLTEAQRSNLKSYLSSLELR